MYADSREAGETCVYEAMSSRSAGFWLSGNAQSNRDV